MELCLLIETHVQERRTESGFDRGNRAKRKETMQEPSHISKFDTVFTSNYTDKVKTVGKILEEIKTTEQNIMSMDLIPTKSHLQLIHCLPNPHIVGEI